MTEKLAFIHPDLGIGGAEQLVVNLCLGARQEGYEPHIFTPRHHKSFPETHDGTIIVHEHGSLGGLLPDTIKGKLKGALAYIRTLLCTFWVVVWGWKVGCRVVVADQVSVVLPLLRLFGFKTIFYCHYPDKLLAQQGGLLKKVYRFFMDTWEETSLLWANTIYVNSRFTQEVFAINFPILRKWGIVPKILYPAIDLAQFDQPLAPDESTELIKKQLTAPYFFSLNRYERKKNIGLAIQAYAELLKAHPQLKSGKQRVDLVIAGGYDPAVPENIEHKAELQALAVECEVRPRVHFYTAVSNETRKYLLRRAECVLYTPSNQHFGIVPVEAMYMGVPIIADNSGGPKESVGEGCGYLCNSKSDWHDYMWRLLSGEAKKMVHGRQQVINKFSFDKFSADFVSGITNLAPSKAKRP